MSPLIDSESLMDKRVLVTAGANGIGLEIARQFQRAGARVYVCDVAEDALTALQKTDPQIVGSRADVSTPADVEDLFKSVQSKLGGLDFLINNAGIAGPTALVEDIDPLDWQKTVNVNLNGQFYCARLAVPMMKRAGGGGIVNLATVAARLGYPMRSAYAASKWAVIGLTQSLAMELGPFHIRVNAILPGSVDGDRMNRVNAARSQALGISMEAVKELDLAAVSLRTYIPARHVAGMALYLCSELGSTISGQSMNVCGNVETLR